MLHKSICTISTCTHSLHLYHQSTYQMIVIVHIVQKFLSIRQRIHSKRLRILNTLWSDFWIGVTFTSQTSSSLPHLCDNKKFPDSILERHSSLLLSLLFSYSRVKKPRATAEIKFWLTKPFRLGQWRKCGILNICFLTRASQKNNIVLLWNIYGCAKSPMVFCATTFDFRPFLKCLLIVTYTNNTLTQ